MFTDDSTTPLHLETLIEVMRRLGSRKVARDVLYGVLQPKGVANALSQSRATIRAATELGLLNEIGTTDVELADAAKGRRSVRECVREALDSRVLANMEVEPYFALFYSYMLGLRSNAGKRTRDEWATAFNRDVYDNNPPKNQFNQEKRTGLDRWFEYTGLGWNDPSGEFQCNPYDRVRRRLRDIFGGDKKLDDDTFMLRLSATCPELDGGDIFQRANRDRGDARQCTLGLSHALIDLHLDGRIRLHCSPDSAGWSLKLASPPTDGKSLLSDRIDFVEIKKGAK